MTSTERSDNAIEQLTLWDALVLISGASVGLWLLVLAGKGGTIPRGVASPAGLVFGFYATISGITMAALPLMVWDRLFRRHVWRAGALSLFLAGSTAWLFLPMIVSGMLMQSRAFDPYTLMLRLHVAHAPGAYAYEAFYHFWPIASAAMLVGCLLSQQAGRWWALATWWPNWLGMWMLAAWSLPAPLIVMQFVQQYWR